MILPFFIGSLEDGDALTHTYLQLQLLDAVSRIAALGFEKSYRETVVLMTRSYLRTVPTVGSVESNTSAPKSRTGHIETLAAGFLTIAFGLMNTKLRADYRHRLLSLSSDKSNALADPQVPPLARASSFEVKYTSAFSDDNPNACTIM